MKQEEDSQKYCLLVCFASSGLLLVESKREQPSVTESGEAIDCRSHSHVPITAVTVRKRTLVHHATGGDSVGQVTE